MVECGAQNDYEAVQETGETFKDSDELKSVSKIINVNLLRGFLFQIIIFWYNT